MLRWKGVYVLSREDGHVLRWESAIDVEGEWNKVRAKRTLKVLLRKKKA